MIRYEVLKTLLPVISDELVVCNIGSPSQELHALDDRATNFYMLGTMGLASSIGFGLALVQDKPVISIDGDGSVLTNLATLSTIANNPRDNFILLIIETAPTGRRAIKPPMPARRHRSPLLPPLAGARMWSRYQPKRPRKLSKRRLPRGA